MPGGAVQELSVVSNLGANESIALTIDLTFDSTGNFTIRVNADSDNAVEELSDFNNLGTLDVTVVPES